MNMPTVCDPMAPFVVAAVLVTTSVSATSNLVGVALYECFRIDGRDGREPHTTPPIVNTAVRRKPRNVCGPLRNRLAEVKWGEHQPIGRTLKHGVTYVLGPMRAPFILLKNVVSYLGKTVSCLKLPFLKQIEEIIISDSILASF